MTEASPDPDPDLSASFETLEPSPDARERMEGVVLAAHAIAHRPLAAEWLELLRAAPVSGTLLVAAAAAVLVIATPLGALFALVSQLG